MLSGTHYQGMISGQRSHLNSGIVAADESNPMPIFFGRLDSSTSLLDIKQDVSGPAGGAMGTSGNELMIMKNNQGQQNYHHEVSTS